MVCSKHWKASGREGVSSLGDTVVVCFVVVMESVTSTLDGVIATGVRLGPVSRLRRSRSWREEAELRAHLDF